MYVSQILFTRKTEFLISESMDVSRILFIKNRVSYKWKYVRITDTILQKTETLISERTYVSGAPVII